VGLVLASGLACAGPRVEVLSVRAQPPSGGLVRVEVLLRNEGGRGEVKVTARLRARGTGRTFVASRGLELERHGTLDAIVDVPAPPGQYEVSAAADYPPE
jgi:hypothetical protein